MVVLAAHQAPSSLTLCLVSISPKWPVVVDTCEKAHTYLMREPHEYPMREHAHLAVSWYTHTLFESLTHMLLSHIDSRTHPYLAASS
jgi:hypothetical protein